jgi:lipoprotein-anchoring transpeptidase ErfK/SrfK
MRGRHIVVDIGRQRLRLLDGPRTVAEFVVSTALKGAGEQRDSERTPRGRHVVRAKIGAGAPLDAVFVGRRPTGEVWSAASARAEPARDWILTRILWLSGREPGRNRLGAVDTMRRYIYIHGAPADVPLGVPGSHGCIRMRGADVIALFDAVPVGTPVDVHE